MSDAPHFIPIAAASGTNAGGKAEGLAVLSALGLNVPDGFVIINATLESLPDDLELAYDRIGRGRVAVRSSASDEDGVATSFAGQHSTVLDVEGMPALRDAVKHCLHSLSSERAQAYRQMRTKGTEASMSIVVQRMVDSRCAGVIFTADPVTARRDRMIVEVVEGLGSELVGGRVKADHFTLDRDGSPVKTEFSSSDPCLRDEELLALASDALRIERHFGLPVECEWAIDRNDQINWLQARPITTLPADPRELDSDVNPGHFYTGCNIAEVFPGVATPLTASTSMRAIDKGMQRMYSSIATMKTISEEPLLYVMQFGRPFINLTELTGISRSMMGGGETNTAEALCGRKVSEIVPGTHAPQSERMVNGLRYARQMLFGRHTAKLKQLIASLDLAPRADALETFAVIDCELPKLTEAWYLHVASSLLEGTVMGALPLMLAKGAQQSEEDRTKIAEMLAGVENVESYDIAAGIDRIVSALIELDGSELDRFLAFDVQEADHFLHHEASSSARREYNAYLERHGHRCLREMEMREKEWIEDPTTIIDAVFSGLRAARAGRVTPPRGKQGSVPLTLAPLVKLGHRGIRLREQTKSQVILVTTFFKRAYRALARQMEDEGRLPDADLIYFLQHAELGELLRNRDSKLIEKALARREVLPFQMKLFFKEVFRGKAEPIDPPRPNEEGALHGSPASLGVARGRARVVLTLGEAGDVQPDEILIAPVIDIGWTPTFATIAGFASDIGSPVAHGAVVAREYGIPMVVNLRNATVTFQTGDLVELDANRGVLRRIAED
jgi:Phosphoenolpyruvate synthase/pyruvate phosphate dikinase